MKLTNIKGTNYPLIPDPRGYFFPVSGSQAIRGNLLSIMLTDKNERVMETDFGLGLSEFIFSLGGPLVEQQVRQRIISGIEQYEPRVTIQNLQVTTENRVLMIKVDYTTYDELNNTQSLTLELPLSDGGDLTI